MIPDDNSFSQSGQKLAQRWMEQYLRTPEKASTIRDSQPDSEKTGPARRRAHRLQTSCLRNLRLYREILRLFIRKEPTPKIHAALLLCLTEIDLSDSNKGPAIIDSWVGFIGQIGGKKTAGFANAVLRKAFVELGSIRSAEKFVPNALLNSHPEWLVDHWIRSLGPLETRRLLEWNQGTPHLYASGFASDLTDKDLQITKWAGFFRLARGITPGIQEALSSGQLTIRDPATRIAEQMLIASGPAKVLDLCSSPGGKSRALLSNPEGPKTIVAADLEDRVELLRENLYPWRERTTVSSINLSKEESLPSHWQSAYDGVLLDAPCSNTGVIQRKPDIKWRLQPADLRKMPQTQLTFLKNAAPFVSPGGTLIYSTCSIEHGENREVVERFLQTPLGEQFQLTAAIKSLPSRSGHDGAGVYRLIRTKDR